MAKVLTERVESGQSPLPKEDIDMAAEAIGYGAIKYFDLRQNPTTDYIFSYERMLDVKVQSINSTVY
jgi:arginyl-tRNA synthetase